MVFFVVVLVVDFMVVVVIVVVNGFNNNEFKYTSTIKICCFNNKEDLLSKIS